jgi:hypothetical protein
LPGSFANSCRGAAGLTELLPAELGEEEPVGVASFLPHETARIHVAVAAKARRLEGMQDFILVARQNSPGEEECSIGKQRIWPFFAGQNRWVIARPCRPSQRVEDRRSRTERSATGPRTGGGRKPRTSWWRVALCLPGLWLPLFRISPLLRQSPESMNNASTFIDL